jgi:hypothetical protein
MFVDINTNAEILKQVTRIADAATRPSSTWAEWTRTLVSFVAGVVSGYVGLLLQGATSDRKEKLKMRRIVYSELAETLIWLYSMITTAKSHGSGRPRLRLIRELCAFEGESYMRENRNVFYQITEAPLLLRLYSDFHTLAPGQVIPISFLEIPFGTLATRALSSLACICRRKAASSSSLGCHDSVLSPPIVMPCCSLAEGITSRLTLNKSASA